MLTQTELHLGVIGHLKAIEKKEWIAQASTRLQAMRVRMILMTRASTENSNVKE